VFCLLHRIACHLHRSELLPTARLRALRQPHSAVTSFIHLHRSGYYAQLHNLQLGDKIGVLHCIASHLYNCGHLPTALHRALRQPHSVTSFIHLHRSGCYAQLHPLLPGSIPCAPFDVDANPCCIPYCPGSIPCSRYDVHIDRPPTAPRCPKSLHSEYTQDPLDSYIKPYSNIKCSVSTL